MTLVLNAVPLTSTSRSGVKASEISILEELNTCPPLMDPPVECPNPFYAFQVSNLLSNDQLSDCNKFQTNVGTSESIDHLFAPPSIHFPTPFEKTVLSREEVLLHHVVTKKGSIVDDMPLSSRSFVNRVKKSTVELKRNSNSNALSVATSLGIMNDLNNDRISNGSRYSRQESTSSVDEIPHFTPICSGITLQPAEPPQKRVFIVKPILKKSRKRPKSTLGKRSSPEKTEVEASAINTRRSSLVEKKKKRSKSNLKRKLSSTVKFRSEISRNASPMKANEKRPVLKRLSSIQKGKADKPSHTSNPQKNLTIKNLTSSHRSSPTKDFCENQLSRSHSHESKKKSISNDNKIVEANTDRLKEGRTLQKKKPSIDKETLKEQVSSNASYNHNQNDTEEKSQLPSKKSYRDTSDMISISKAVKCKENNKYITNRDTPKELRKSNSSKDIQKCNMHSDISNANRAPHRLKETISLKQDQKEKQISTKREQRIQDSKDPLKKGVRVLQKDQTIKVVSKESHDACKQDPIKPNEMKDLRKEYRPVDPNRLKRKRDELEQERKKDELRRQIYAQNRLLRYIAQHQWNVLQNQNSESLSTAINHAV